MKFPYALVLVLLAAACGSVTPAGSPTSIAEDDGAAGEDLGPSPDAGTAGTTGAAGAGSADSGTSPEVAPACAPVVATVSWQTVHGGSLVSCSQIGATLARVRLGGATKTAPCVDATVTFPAVGGPQDLAIDLLAAGGATVAMKDVGQVVLGSCGAWAAETIAIDVSR